VDTGLWHINLRKEIPHNPMEASHSVYDLRNTGSSVNYLHKTIFRPIKAALIKAVKQGHLATHIGLPKDAINTHLKLTPATAMGHMNQKRQHICSTIKVVAITSDLEDTTVTPAGNGEKTHFLTLQ
jgi:hypothetical protein